jgi:DNA-binding MurR/RpiR family transcriptional regulator
MSIKGGIVMLKEMVSNLPPSEQKIAAYIIEHPEEAITATASELGERTMTSGAAVIRLCKSLGLNGLQELKLRVAGDLQTDPEEGYRDLKPNESVKSVIKKMTNNSIQALRETSEIIHTDEISKAVEFLIQASSIHFYGVGASSIIAHDAQQKFLRINKNATAFTDLHMVAAQIANANENDVVMGISFSGETEEVVKVLDMANKKGIQTISLTKYGISPVSERAMIKLFVNSSKEAVFRSGATSSRMAQLHIIDILFMCLATSQYEQTVYYLDQTRELVQPLKVKLNRNQRSND